MIEEKAQVIKTDGNCAWVQAQRKSTCGQCSVQKGCGTSVFSKVLGKRHTQFKAINNINAEAGDEVILGLHESVLLKSALIMYLVPLATMFSSALLVSLILENLSQGWVILAGIIGLATGFMLVKRFATRHSLDPQYQPVILRRVTLTEQTIGLASQP